MVKSDVLNGARHLHGPNEGRPPLDGWPVRKGAGCLSCELQRRAMSGLRLRSISLVFGLIFNYACRGWWVGGGRGVGRVGCMVWLKQPLSISDNMYHLTSWK